MVISFDFTKYQKSLRTRFLIFSYIFLLFLMFHSYIFELFGPILLLNIPGSSPRHLQTRCSLEIFEKNLSDRIFSNYYNF